MKTRGYCKCKAIECNTVPVNVPQLMNRINCKYRLRYVESCLAFCESVVLDEHGHHITTGHILHYQIQIIVVL